MNDILSLTGHKTSKEILKDYIQKLERECHGKQHSTETVRFLIEEKDFTIADMVRYAQTLSASSTAERVDRVTQEKEQEPEHGSQPQEHKPLWQEQVTGEKPAFRVALPSDTTVSMEVKVLEPVRKASKELAAAHGMTAQQLVEHLLVDALNNSPKELEQGKKRLKEFKGSTAKARRFAEREELARLRQLPSFPNR